MHRHKLSQLKPALFLKPSHFTGISRSPCHERNALMHARFRVIETTTLVLITHRIGQRPDLFITREVPHTTIEKQPEQWQLDAFF